MARAQKSATVLDLPGDVLGLVLERLHPHALARAACVSREWRARAESADRWRSLALAAFGETRSFAAAKDKNASTRNFEELPNRGAPTSPRSWRRAFLVARKRWPEMAPRKHTGRAFCETCQTLAWFPGFGGPSFRFGDGGGGESESGGVVFTSREKNTRASCGCAPATFAPRRRLKKKRRRRSLRRLAKRVYPTTPSPPPRPRSRSRSRPVARCGFCSGSRGARRGGGTVPSRPRARTRLFRRLRGRARRRPTTKAREGCGNETKQRVNRMVYCVALYRELPRGIRLLYRYTFDDG